MLSAGESAVDQADAIRMPRNTSRPTPVATRAHVPAMRSTCACHEIDGACETERHDAGPAIGHHRPDAAVPARQAGTEHAGALGDKPLGLLDRSIDQRPEAHAPIHGRPPTPVRAGLAQETPSLTGLRCQQVTISSRANGDAQVGGLMPWPTGRITNLSRPKRTPPALRQPPADPPPRPRSMGRALDR